MITRPVGNKQLETRIQELKVMFSKFPEYDFSKSGTTIELIHSNDPYTELKRGDIGTIELIKKNNGIENQIWVSWKSGSNLMLLQGKDSYAEIDGDCMEYYGDDINQHFDRREAHE